MRPAPGAPPGSLRTYDIGARVVDPAHMADYAAATDDESIVYWGPDAIAPPMLHARLMRDLLFAMFEDPVLDIDFQRLLHGGHDARFLRPLHPWDAVNLRGAVLAIHPKRSGRIIEARMVGFVAGRPAVDVRTTLFVRDSVPTEVWSPGPPLPARGESPTATRDFHVSADQAERYAAASLDDNPLHRDQAFARSAAFPDVVLHGLCTMAKAGSTVLKRFYFDDGRKLRRLATRFAAPVLLDQTLTTRMWNTGLTTRFEVVDHAGRPVLCDGLMVVED